jgi:hypothetical protein
MSVFFKDPMMEERQLLYWKAMRDRCSINEWVYACDQAMERETFHTVPLPAVMMPYCLEYRAERRRQWLEHVAERHRLLSQGEEPSRDPAFPGTEKERKAVIAQQAEQQRAILEAKWATLEAQGQQAGPKPYRKLGPEDLRYIPTEDPAKARARAMTLLAELRRDEESEHGPLH